MAHVKDEGGRILPHEPTKDTRRTAEVAASYGVPHHMIATLVGISEPTLRKHYKPELEAGKAKATFQVAKTLFDRATTGKDLGAAIFWLKAQAGWREKHVLDDDEPGKNKLSTLLGSIVQASGLNDAPEAPKAYVDPQDNGTRQ